MSLPYIIMNMELLSQEVGFMLYTVMKKSQKKIAKKYRTGNRMP